MPQLDLNPWAFIFCMTWLTLLTQIPTKIESRRYCSAPSKSLDTKAVVVSWNWPW